MLFIPVFAFPFDTVAPGEFDARIERALVEAMNQGAAELAHIL
jgi:hypothetical protein